MDVQILGSAELKRLAAQIRAEGDKGLGREMGNALRKASTPVQQSIRQEYQGLPTRGGYAGVFSKSLRFRATLRGAARTASYRLLTFADGTHERRDINRLEKGELRHPVYGRSRAGRSGRRTSNPWATTTVRGDFHQRGTDNAADLAERQMTVVLREYSARLIN